MLISIHGTAEHSFSGALSSVYAHIISRGSPTTPSGDHMARDRSRTSARIAVKV
jgi:hypothetical protein